MKKFCKEFTQIFENVKYFVRIQLVQKLDPGERFKLLIRTHFPRSVIFFNLTSSWKIFSSKEKI